MEYKALEKEKYISKCKKAWREKVPYFAMMHCKGHLIKENWL